MMLSKHTTAPPNIWRQVVCLLSPSEVYDYLLCFDGPCRCLCTIRPGVPPRSCRPFASLFEITRNTYSGVISKFNYGIGGVDGGAVRGEKKEGYWAQHTTLWGFCVQDKIGGGFFSNPDPLWSVGEEVHESQAEGCTQTQIAQFADKFVRDYDVKNEAEFHKYHPHIDVWLFQVCQCCVECGQYCVRTDSVHLLGKTGAGPDLEEDNE